MKKVIATILSTLTFCACLTSCSDDEPDKNDINYWHDLQGAWQTVSAEGGTVSDYDWMNIESGGATSARFNGKFIWQKSVTGSPLEYVTVDDRRLTVTDYNGNKLVVYDNSTGISRTMQRLSNFTTAKIINDYLSESSLIFEVYELDQDNKHINEINFQIYGVSSTVPFLVFTDKLYVDVYSPSYKPLWNYVYTMSPGIQNNCTID